MSEQNELDESLKDYKQKVATDLKCTLTWDKDLIFEARTQRGYVIEYDAKVEWGIMPTESLLTSLAGCMAIDVLMFLQKMRMEITGFKINAVADRNPEPPQYFKGVKMHITIKGKRLDAKKVDRAVALSKDKYCSVYHSMRKDMSHEVTYELVEEG